MIWKIFFVLSSFCIVITAKSKESKKTKVKGILIYSFLAILFAVMALK